MRTLRFSFSSGRRALAQAAQRLSVLLGMLVLVSCGGEAGEQEDSGILVIEGAMIFTSPGVPPIPDGTVLVIDGVIEAIGPRGEVPIPASALLVDGTNLSLLAGFWNVHVQIDDEILEAAASAPAEELQALLWERFTRFGFSTIVETSRPREELAQLIERIDSGEVLGPRILMAGGMEVPRVYYPDPLAFPWTEDLFTSLAGGDVALVTGIELQRRALNVLYSGDLDAVSTAMDGVLEEFRPFEESGGRFLFGTGAGYIEQYDPMSDHILLEDTGVSFAARLSALTMEPSVRFGFDYLGAIESGMVADLVLVDGDPEADITSLGRVHIVLREGRAIYW